MDRPLEKKKDEPGTLGLQELQATSAEFEPPVPGMKQAEFQRGLDLLAGLGAVTDQSLKPAAPHAAIRAAASAAAKAGASSAQKHSTPAPVPTPTPPPVPTPAATSSRRKYQGALRDDALVQALLELRGRAKSGKVNLRPPLPPRSSEFELPPIEVIDALPKSGSGSSSLRGSGGGNSTSDVVPVLRPRQK